MRPLLFLWVWTFGICGLAQRVEPWQEETPQAAIATYIAAACSAKDVRSVVVEVVDSIGVSRKLGHISLVVVTAYRFDGGVVPFHLELPCSAAVIFQDTVFTKSDSTAGL